MGKPGVGRDAAGATRGRTTVRSLASYRKALVRSTVDHILGAGSRTPSLPVAVVLPCPQAAEVRRQWIESVDFATLDLTVFEVIKCCYKPCFCASFCFKSPFPYLEPPEFTLQSEMSHPWNIRDPRT